MEFGARWNRLKLLLEARKGVRPTVYIRKIGRKVLGNESFVILSGDGCGDANPNPPGPTLPGLNR